MFDAELDSFKRIDLRAYAASQGYALDRRESSRSSAVMRHANGDKIVIKINASDGHYVYFSVRDEKDNGTILDFLEHREKLNFGEIRKQLRPWTGAPPLPVPRFEPMQACSKDRLGVETAYAKMPDTLCHPYLENERALPSSLLQDERFADRIRTDARGNAIFPHFDGDGLCGFEKKNSGFTGFSAGGTKGLWLSHELPGDNRFAFFESAIDALSHAVLFPEAHTRYASIGGKPNPVQPELIRAAIARMPSGAEIVAAMDADEDGRKLNKLVRRAFELTGRGDLRFRIHEPSGFKDWNDMLRARPEMHGLKPPAEVTPV
jgi:hypothetical protein